MIVSPITIISLKRNILALKVLEAHNFKIKITLKLKKKKKKTSVNHYIVIMVHRLL